MTMIAETNSADAFDSLADMFLGGVSSPAPDSPPKTEHPAASENTHTEQAFTCTPSLDQTPVTAAHPIIEGLILGHLPMMASLWAAQYVRMCTAQSGLPVGMIRLDAASGQARVELFQPSSDGAQALTLGCPAGSSLDLAAAIDAASHKARRIVVLATDASQEVMLAVSPRIHSMAVLTGADDASAVAAYKTIKRLASHTHERPSDAPATRFRIAVLGSDKARADALWHRLSDSAREFLDVHIEYAGHAKQIAGGVPGSLLFDGSSAMTLQAIIEGITHNRPGPADSSSPATTPRPSTTDTAPMNETANGHYTHTAPAHTTHTPVASRLPQTPEAKPAGTLLAGFSPLAIRCPFDAAAILAVDGSGVPQVILSAVRGNVAEATHRLVTVGAWLWSNRELLAMILPGKLNADTRPTLHLLTDKPAEARRLLDSDIRIHIVVEPSQLTSGPVCLALN